MPKISFIYNDIHFKSLEIDIEDIIESIQQHKVSIFECTTEFNKKYKIVINWSVPYINLYIDIRKSPINDNPIFKFSLIWD